jgi:3-phosphoshikimate 1-carboxyvinyltransferase
MLGNIKIDGDKSISHRSLLFASQAVGITKISNLLESEDVLATKSALESLGVKITKESGKYFVEGNGLRSLVPPVQDVYCGNSGTLVRLIAGLIAGSAIEACLTGDASLQSRPMQRIIDPLGEFGIEIESRDKGLLPLLVKGSSDAVGIDYKMKIASAQVKSAILLAALNANGKTIIHEKSLTRDHTELMMQYLGYDIKLDNSNSARKITFTPGESVQAKDITVPSDPSSAAFFIVAALLVPDSHLLIENVGINYTRIGLFEVLTEMGAKIKYLNEREVSGEMVADLEVQYSNLHAVEVKPEIAPRMIDEYPILAVAAACAEGVTRMRGLSELRVKESDRLNAIIVNLEKFGVGYKVEGDDLLVYGGKFTNNSGDVKVESFADHRIAMAFIVLASVLSKQVEVDDIDMIATSFPDFLKLYNSFVK